MVIVVRNVIKDFSLVMTISIGLDRRLCAFFSFVYNSWNIPQEIHLLHHENEGLALQ